MSDKPKYNPNIHHRKSIRLKGYDYSQPGLYFITICCQDRICRFGKIENGEMILNDVGNVARECWLEIPKHFPGAVLHEFIVMPNHFHGIIELTENVGANVGTQNCGIENLGGKNVGAQNFVPLPPQPIQHPKPETTYRNQFQKIIPRSIGSIIRGYKIGLTVRAKNILPEKIWQRNYYEHIIRNEQSYQTISEYIMNNPSKWEEDKFFNDQQHSKGKEQDQTVEI